MIRAGIQATGLAICALWMAQQAQGGTLTLKRIDSSPAPITVRAAPDYDSASGYVLGLLDGNLRALEDDGTLRATEALDLATIDDFDRAWDIAFAPDGDKAYLSYNVATGNDDQRFDHVVAEVTRDTEDPSRFDPGSLKRILTVPHPGVADRGGHFGGAIDLGPDDMLYITTGDSNLSGYQGDTTGDKNVSQDTGDLRGAVLRIDPRRDDFPADAARNYAIPEDNPDFGEPDNDPTEFWAIGLRNPFKARWDLTTGRMFIADVGEEAWEEVNLGVSGANYGWPEREGPDPLFEGELSELGTLTEPLYAYPHDSQSVFGGQSITGGEVYRGALEALDGQYVFADYRRNQTDFWLWSFDAESEPGDIRKLTAWSLDVLDGEDAPKNIIGLGSDADGRFYIADQNDGLFVVTNAVTAIPLPGGLALALGGIMVLGGVGGLKRRPRRSACDA